jgi:nicotinate-nucleotide adenylyltransferase
MNIGLFGGTFDPIHLGHLIISELILEELELNQVWLVPAAQPPHKLDHTISSFSHRAAMAERAIHNNPRLAVNRIEETLTGPSYTVQTLRLLTESFPLNRYFLIIGADSFVNFDQWKDPWEILDLCVPVVYPRSGYDCSKADQRLMEKSLFPGLPLIGLSSSVIRERIKALKTVRYMVPDCVAQYIQQHQLYR